jgi:hypothetical protein
MWDWLGLVYLVSTVVNIYPPRQQSPKYVSFLYFYSLLSRLCGSGFMVVYNRFHHIGMVWYLYLLPDYGHHIGGIYQQGIGGLYQPSDSVLYI